MAGEPTNEGKGRSLPKWEKWWREDFDQAHLSRIAMWKKGNEEARKRIRRENGEESKDLLVAALETREVRDVEVNA